MRDVVKSTIVEVAVEEVGDLAIEPRGEVVVGIEQRRIEFAEGETKGGVVDEEQRGREGEQGARAARAQEDEAGDEIEQGGAEEDAKDADAPAPEGGNLRDEELEQQQVEAAAAESACKFEL